MEQHEARKILKKYDYRLLAHTPKGVGSGLTIRNGEWEMDIFVGEKANAHRWLEKLEKIDGIKLNVIVTGEFKALSTSTLHPSRTVKRRPVQGGISVGHPDITAGTIGAMVWDEGHEKKMILSNNHVLANCNLAKIGDPIYQPGAYDGGTAADTIAHLTKFKEIIFDNSAGPYNYADCAVATLDDPDQIIDDILEINNRDVATGGVASASDYINNDHSPDKAFDAYGNLPYSGSNPSAATSWVVHFDGVTPQWLRYDLPTPFIVTKYFIRSTAGLYWLQGWVDWPEEAPKDWTFQGSNDGVNWDILDTVTGETDWTFTIVRIFEINNVTAYKSYRIVITANNGSTDLSIGNLELIYEDGKLTPGTMKRTVAVGDVVKKSGRTSGVIFGTVQYISGVMGVGYGASGAAYFDDLIVTSAMAEGGDSGSLLLSADNHPVGLLFGGSSTLTVHCRIGHVADALQIIFDADEPTKIFTGVYDIEEYWKVLIAQYDIMDFEKQLGAVYHLGQSPYPVYTLEQLQEIGKITTRFNDVFDIKADIDATPTREWNWDETLGIYRGFDPIDKNYITIHGNYYIIRNLYINRPDEDNVGLFGTGYSFKADKIILVDVNITGHKRVGALAGYAVATPQIDKCIASGTVSSMCDYSYIGGMVGHLNWGSLNCSEFRGTINGINYIGGMVGVADGTSVAINDCYCEGVITSTSLSPFYICGFINGGYCTRCYSAMAIILPSGHSAPFRCGGFTSVIDEAIQSCYWDSDICDVFPVDSIARTTAEMQVSETFVGWDFTNVWIIIQYKDYPRLRYGLYFIESMESIGFEDRINAVNLMSRLHEAIDFVDAYGFVNLRDTLPHGIQFSDFIRAMVEYTVQTEQAFGFSDLLTINIYARRYLRPEIGFSDKMDFINWTGFVKQNKEFFVERYFCTLEGPGSLAAIDLPISSFQGRRRENESTYLSVVVADSDYYNQIVARQGGTLRVYMGYEVFGEIYLRQIILQATLEHIYYSRGGEEQSIQLVGHKTYSYSPKTTYLDKISYKRISDGLITVRCPTPDLFINPGDTIVTPDETFRCGDISYNVSLTQQYMQQAMEITESEEA